MPTGFISTGSLGGAISGLDPGTRQAYDLFNNRDESAQRPLDDVSEKIAGTLHFTLDGAVAGRSSCNTYRVSYTLTGEGLTISRPRNGTPSLRGATRRAHQYSNLEPTDYESLPWGRTQRK